MIDAGKQEIGKRYAGPCIGEPDTYRWGDPGWDCSSFVATMYRRALGISLTAYTDAIANETPIIPSTDALPGDVLLWRYYDSSQPSTRYPHVSLVYSMSAALVLDARYNNGLSNGVKVWPFLHAPFEIHRPMGL